MMTKTTETKARHAPGPWEAIRAGSAAGIVPAKPAKGIRSRDVEDIAQVSLMNEQYDTDANIRLICAAPAYAEAWALVPDDMKGRIFDVLHVPSTEWVEESIREATQP